MDDKKIDKNKCSNYSKVDGKILKSIGYMDINLEKDKGDICKHCGEKTNSEYNYCKVCGTQLYEAFELEKSKYKNENKLPKKKILLTSVSAITILILVSVVYKSIIFKDLVDIKNIVNPLHMLLAMNLGIIDIFSSSMISSQVISVRLGMLVLILWPIIALSISNLIFMKKNNENIKSIMLNSIGVGITYGLILVIISILSTVGSNSYDLFKYGYSIGYGFRTFGLLINGFIIGFVCTFTYGIIRRTTLKNKYIDILKVAIKAIGIGYIFVFILLTILYLSNSSYLHELGIYKYSSYVSVGVVLSQLAAYVWAFSNLIQVIIGSSSISVISISGSNLFFNTKLIFFAMVALSLLIMIASGSKLKTKYKENSIKPVLVFSIFYSISMGILGMFTGIIVSSDTTSIAMGFGVVSAMVIAFVYSFVVAMIGYKLS